LGELSSIFQAANDLLRFLDPNFTLEDDESKTPPLVLFAFDEAHALSYPETGKGMPASPTAFSEMRRAIRQMNPYPVFALFLSTTGKIHDFTPPPKDDPSQRLTMEQYSLIPPFTELGFDQMVKADDIKIDNLYIDDLSRLGYMVKFGRPL
jgi:hypothetical protein